MLFVIIIRARRRTISKSTSGQEEWRTMGISVRLKIYYVMELPKRRFLVFRLAFMSMTMYHLQYYYSWIQRFVETAQKENLSRIWQSLDQISIDHVTNFDRYLKVQILYKTLWTFRPLIYKLSIQALYQTMYVWKMNKIL